eukprot:GSMAST32.ASY1.ANO1.2101.1 assembled CDS
MAQTSSLTLSQIRRLSFRALNKSGLNQVSSKVLANVITAAERDGCLSHGLFRVPGYCSALISGKIDGTTSPKAKSNGIAVAAFKNSAHFSALWYEAETLAREGIASLVFVNTKAFVAHSPGGKERVYGTNPMSFGFPRHTQKPSNKGTEWSTEPFVFDMASSATARGEIQIAQREGKKLPQGAAVDVSGNPTTDPTLALQGSQLPFGGHKGSVIALMIELLAAGSTGSPFAFETHRDDTKNDNTPTINGQMIVAMQPRLISGFIGESSDSFSELKNQTNQLDPYYRIEQLFQAILGNSDDANDSSVFNANDLRLPSYRRYKQRLQTEKNGFVEVQTELLHEIEVFAN